MGLHKTNAARGAKWTALLGAKWASVLNLSTQWCHQAQFQNNRFCRLNRVQSVQSLVMLFWNNFQGY